MLQYVGLDVSPAEVAICVVDEDGTIEFEGTAPSEPYAIADWLLDDDVHPEKVGLEIGGLARRLYAELAARGLPMIIGFMIEEKLDRVSHVVTPAEIKEKAEYERKCALADRGIGYRPWRPPTIPDYDYVPNGELMLKFDHDYAEAGRAGSFPMGSASGSKA